MSVLLPSTVAVLRTVQPCAPLFSNMSTAELFEAAHSRGSLRVLPRTIGGYVVFDTEAPNGEGIVEDDLPTEAVAHEALERHAKKKAKRR